MAAIVELDEINGAGLVVTHGILNSRFGSVDATSLDDAANPIPPGTNSFEKWVRAHVTDMGGAAKVKGVAFWSATARPTGSAFQCNGHVTQATYDGSKKMAAEQPGTGTTKTPYAVPTFAPGSPNIGIGGSLTGELTAPGFSDYIVAQIRLTAGVAESADPALNYDYQEVA